MQGKCINIHMKIQNNYSSNIYKHILTFPLTYPDKRQCTFRIKTIKKLGVEFPPYTPTY